MVSWGELFSTFLARKIMGAKHSFRSPNGGGVPSFMPSLHMAKGLPFCLPESPFLPSIVANFQTIRAKQGKNKFLFDVLLCFLGIFGDNKGRNLNIFLKSRREGGVLRWSAACLLACPLGYDCRLFGASGPSRVLAVILWSCVPSFCPLSRFVFGVLSLNMVLFRVFRGF